ncbi:MAG: Phosphate regulon transcriptional regulatory protein PhoB (SphR) [uncultured Thermomicrobiales bacterium]|uniref:Phosphate regulon transcriptional regulatory protein PhoB n=1 Tax=uncultured Thermomicrobiales bacterium TaxID=1645740 RepID=A0A6J4VRX9_9BACT|nr:MAG: Phosphate regulon transcriptional regulatory protein PhoB (SphR) [uncultured Thermomicrobiales bacterium]
MHQARSVEQGKLILIVDDEPIVRETVAINLRREGLKVVFASDGLEAIETARSANPDVVVLDIMLPGMDGFEVCRTIREESTVPIILLSARGEEIDRVVGLELGADDFLVKPFAMRELVARVRAMLRRAKMVTAAGEPASATVEPARRPGAPVAGRAQLDSGRIESGDVAIDVPRRRASVAGEMLDLKPKEFDLLAYFVRQPEIVLTREALLREVWGYAYHVDTRTVDVHVRWLRQKIEDDPAQPRRIVTVRGHGYRFVSHVVD